MYEQLIKGRWMAKQVHRQLQSASSDSASQLSKSPGTGIWATQILDHSICGSAVRETVAGLAPRIGQTRTDGMTTGTAQKDRQAGLSASHSSDSPLQIGLNAAAAAAYLRGALANACVKCARCHNGGV